MAAWGIVARRRYGVRFFASGFSKKWFLQPQSLVDLAAVTPGILQAFGVGGELLQGSRILRILRLLRLIRCVPPHTHTHKRSSRRYSVLGLRLCSRRHLHRHGHRQTNRRQSNFLPVSNANPPQPVARRARVPENRRGCSLCGRRSGDTNNRFFLLKNAGEVTVKLYEILVEFFVIFFTTSAIIFNIEHAVNPEFGDLGDSLYWAFLTLTGNEQPFDVRSLPPRVSPSPTSL